MTRTLVTGATGFIGRHTVATLLESGQEVTAMGRFSKIDVRNRDWLDRSPAWSSREIFNKYGDRLSIVAGDIRDTDRVGEAMDGVDRVIHLAAAVATRSAAHSDRINVEGTAVIARAAIASGRQPTFLYVSSLAAAGPCESRDKAKSETDACHPVSLYGRTKLRAEHVLHEMAGELPITIVRPPCVIGPGDRNLLALCKSVVSGWNFVLSKKDLYSFVSVVDLVPGMIAALQHGVRLAKSTPTDPIDPTLPGVYYLTDPQPVTFEQLADRIADCLPHSKRVRHVRVPATIGWIIGTGGEIVMRCANRRVFLNLDKIREGLAGSWVCEGDRAADELGFAPAADLWTRVAETINDYQQSDWL